MAETTSSTQFIRQDSWGGNNGDPFEGEEVEEELLVEAEEVVVLVVTEAVTLETLTQFLPLLKILQMIV